MDSNPNVNRRARVIAAALLFPWMLLVAGLFFNDPGDGRWKIGVVLASCATLPLVTAWFRAYLVTGVVSGAVLIGLAVVVPYGAFLWIIPGLIYGVTAVKLR